MITFSGVKPLGVVNMFNNTSVSVKVRCSGNLSYVLGIYGVVEVEDGSDQLCNMDNSLRVDYIKVICK